MSDQPSNLSMAMNDGDLRARDPQRFPRLDDDMAQRIRAYGTEESVPAGTLLFQRGQRGVDFFFVIEGAIQVFNIDHDQQIKIITTHSHHQFSGEIDQLSYRQILASGLTMLETRLIRIKREGLLRLMVAETDIGEIIMRAFILRRIGLIQLGSGGVVIIGSGHDGDTLRLQRFLVRNGYPYRLLDMETDADAHKLIMSTELTPSQLPVVMVPDHDLLKNPTTAELADSLGLTESIDIGRIYDVVVVGAGPAGLAATVYAASEGLDTLVIEGLAPGGQAGTSSKIENYLGFPTGISGQDLAGRAQIQAQKFGARLAISRYAVGLECASHPYRVRLDDGQLITARAVVIATGARYRKLDVSGYNQYEGQGIHYAATPMEGQLCAKEQVVVVGGGNSAGQAAVFLSRLTAHVHVLIRAAGLAATMSDYLIQRIQQSNKITLHTETEVVGLSGMDRLQNITWMHRPSGERVTMPIANMFVMVGAEPNTDWLCGCLQLDPKGFVSTGSNVEGQSATTIYATSRPGIFAVGDVRSGSVKRVASGVGEGAAVVASIHRFLDAKSS
jgi:thioredoxin reductase (NADPH)